MSYTAYEWFVRFLLVASFWFPVMMIRNYWVLRTRLRWIVEDVESYRVAVDYNTMLYRIWVWRCDVESWHACTPGSSG